MKKIIAVFVLASSLIGSYSYPAFAADFPDVTDANRFFNEIHYLLNEGIITGFPDGQFYPEGKVTRGQAAIMIGKALGYSDEPQETRFTDVGRSVISSGSIAALVENDIISGYPDGTFRPEAEVSRAEMALLLYRAFDLGYEGEPSFFFDVHEGMKAYEAIQQLSAWGVAAGYQLNRFRPDMTLTREQFAAFMARVTDPVEFSVGEKEVEVAFLDVGQGDAIYLEYANGEAILIDAGPSAEEISQALDEIGAKKIETLIVTHPDPEHMGGAAWVLKNQPISKVYDSGLRGDTEAYKNYLQEIEANGAALEIVEIGDDLSTDPKIPIEVIYVDPEAENLDDGGMVLNLTADIWKFLLAGDATPEVQEYLVDKVDLEAKILKVPHHGDEEFYTYPFVDEADPRMSILSYGKNTSGHPDDSVINDLRASGSDIYDTYKQGNIIYSISKDVMQTNVQFSLHGYGQLVPDIRFTKKDLVGEVVQLTNYDRVNADLTGFKLVSVNGKEVFGFPTGFILRSGKSVNITSGPDAIHSPPESLKWTEKPVWEDKGDPAKLYEPGDFLLVETP